MEGNGDGVGEEGNTRIHTRINPPAWPDYTPRNMMEGDMASQSVTLGVFCAAFYFAEKSVPLKCLNLACVRGKTP